MDGQYREVLLEKVLAPEPEATYPRCVAGKRACPPEDSLAAAQAANQARRGKERQ